MVMLLITALKMTLLVIGAPRMSRGMPALRRDLTTSSSAIAFKTMVRIGDPAVAADQHRDETRKRPEAETRAQLPCEITCDK